MFSAPAQIGDGPGDFQDAVVGAGAQVVLGHGQLQEIAGGFAHFAEGFKFAQTYPRVSSTLRLNSGHSSGNNTLLCRQNLDRW